MQFAQGKASALKLYDASGSVGSDPYAIVIHMPVVRYALYTVVWQDIELYNYLSESSSTGVLGARPHLALRGGGAGDVGLNIPLSSGAISLALGFLGDLGAILRGCVEPMVGISASGAGVSLRYGT
jgi:hypothetical protein